MINPLVSIVVITYNSASYILETLQSIYDQSYQSIELILADDASTDDTVRLCKSWLDQYNDRFERLEIISNGQNVGIPGNCNRGVDAARGEWIKIIAGDDLLTVNCIQDNINFGMAGRESPRKCILSNMIAFLDSDYSVEERMTVHERFFRTRSAEDQYNELLKAYCGNSPTYFIHQSVFKLQRYDEKYPFMEDYPFALNITRKGVYIHYMETITVRYRVRAFSAFNEENVLFSGFYKKKRSFDKIERLPRLSFWNRAKENWLYHKMCIFDALKLNKPKSANRFLFTYIDLMNPIILFDVLYNKVKRKF